MHTSSTEPLAPAEALDRIVYLLDRGLQPPQKVRAFQKAAAIVRELGDDDRIYVGAWTRIVVRPATPEEKAASAE